VNGIVTSPLLACCLGGALLTPVPVAHGGLIFQESGGATLGATRTLSASSSIQSGDPFNNSSGAYLKSTAPAGSGTITIATFNPVSPDHSWAALTGDSIHINGVNYLNLNGAFEIFVRPNSIASGAGWFRPVDVVINKPFRIIFASGTSFQLQVLTSSSAALGAAPGAFTTGNSFSLPGGMSSIPSPFTLGSVTHLGFTIETAENGQITIKVFGTGGTGQMDTSSDTVGVGNLLAKQSFYADADAIGANPLPRGPWSMSARPNGATFTSITSADYDTIRLYDAVPEIFPAADVLLEFPEPPPPDWSTFTSRKQWLLGLNWPGPSPSKYGMPYNLATFHNHPAGTPQSNLAVTYTTNLLAQLTVADLSSSEFLPLGIVRAIHQFADRFDAQQLARIGADAQRMYNWYGGGTENHHLMRLANSYLLTQKFPSGQWHTGGSGSAKVSSATLMARNKEELRKEGKLRYSRSFSEALSPNYLMVHIIPLQHLYEFAQDPEVKHVAEAMLLHILAQLAANVYEGYILDPYPRFNNFCFLNGGIGPGAEDGEKNATLLLNWLFWNQSVPDASRFTTFSDTLFPVYPALSSYPLLPALERIANISSDTPGKAHWVRTSEPNWPHNNYPIFSDVARRRVWRDREFALSSVVGYHVPVGFYLQDGSRMGLAYRSTDRLQYIQAGHPYWRADEGGLGWWQAPHSPFMQVAHHQSTAIVMFNIPPTDPWPTSGRQDFYLTDRNVNPPSLRRSEHWNSLRTDCAVRYPLTMDETSEMTNADGTTWYFLREGHTYIGIRTLTSAGVPQQDNFWRIIHATAVPHGGRSQTGFIIEIGTSMASGGEFDSFAAFQSALASRTPEVTWGSGDTPSLAVAYTDHRNVTIATQYDTNLASDTGGKVRMFPETTLNGVPDPSDPWPDLDARLSPDQPMVTMVNNVLTIHDPDTGEAARRIDWNGNLPIISELPKFQSTVSAPGQITISWTGNGQLQWAPAVHGPWESFDPPITTSPSVQAVGPGESRFYRLKTPE